ncbi:alpha/beta fold hydrolase [Pseudonocardia parietis]|uniref:Pimeloyl-ACP methyl ester carboxylesterase n=1 Tax=Pseudonocardia parietis TaxID=570936 RepID=A0ABS4VQH3_9PSEU|nr:alpha/beta fold hydrolase [Pseudonocardia parietis]MBP2366164.1 pimeloyl-ACP methyl ester carboxylesterase [Pseudonocardia parietis]
MSPGSAGVVLVHGAWHRGSSWAPVVTELERAGVPVAAPDLPSDGPEAGHAELVDPVLAAAEGPVVLAGHSLGGLVAAVAAGRLDPTRVRALVLVAALVPEPGRSYLDRMRAERDLMVPGYDTGVLRGEGMVTYWPDAATAAAGLYRGVADELAVSADRAAPADRAEAAVAAATARMRPQDWTVLKEACPLSVWPAVRTVSVICTGDRVVDPDGARRDAARVGAEVVEFPGGHFPMLTRPGELADLLARLAIGPGVPPGG